MKNQHIEMGMKAGKGENGIYQGWHEKKTQYEKKHLKNHLNVFYFEFFTFLFVTLLILPFDLKHFKTH